MHIMSEIYRNMEKKYNWKQLKINNNTSYFEYSCSEITKEYFLQAWCKKAEGNNFFKNLLADRRSSTKKCVVEEATSNTFFESSSSGRVSPNWVGSRYKLPFFIFQFLQYFV